MSIDAKALYTMLEQLSPFKETPFDYTSDSPAALWTALRFSDYSVVWRRRDKATNSVKYKWGVVLPPTVAKRLETTQDHAWETYEEYETFVLHNLSRMHNVTMRS